MDLYSGMPLGGSERSNAPQDLLSKKSIPEIASAATTQIQSADELRKAKLQGYGVSISEEELVRAIDKAIKAIQGPSTQLDFSIHEQTRRIMVKVINKDSGEIIREIPPEKNLDFLVNLWKMAGIMIDERR